MFPGVEIAVGYVFAWAVRKARLVAGRADGEVDRALEAGMDRVHDVVSRKLGGDPALEQVAEEAGEDRAQLSDETRQWLALSLNNAAKKDEEFAAALKAAVEEVQAAERAVGGGGVSASGDGIAVGGTVEIHAEGGSVAAVRIDGPVTLGAANPPQPGTGRG
ncbi:hypothetical protein [Kitasatospora sp. SUK 42]|uniref:hypothetical protein n=1 Tax=Kitasatospora sp. SUK 42 TaxID=1588882 RepID=UPI0018CA94D0|nr:hypothetical protein [Kitasatospora sp. SUK 42]MBV2153354.1 hypothetical protein [Kitasatospora sp. SUK 42]